MDFAFSEEQDEFRETLRRFFAERVPSAELRRVMETPEGHEPALWKQLAAELGLQGIAIPEELGGQGFGFLELGIAFEEMGRVLLPGPALASVGLAASAIRATASEAQQRALLPGIASGETIATLAWNEPGCGWSPKYVAATAEPDGGGWRLRGRKALVLDGASASLVVVAAREADGSLGLYAVAGDDPGLRAEGVESLDPLRRHADLELAGARGERLGAGDASAALEGAIQRGAILLAAEMLGAAQRCLEMAVDYAKERVQFARPIGSFQALKHKAAEVLLEVECARSAAYWSWWVAEQGDPHAVAEAAHVAKAVCGDALARAAAENVQIHGGIGFTWEHDAQLFYKRAIGADILLGDADWHRARLARLLGI